MMMLPCNSEELAYFAGLLDGEGSFTVVVAKNRQNHRKPWHRGTKRTGNGIQLIPQITFGLQSKELVEWAKEKFGGISFSRKTGGMYGWRLVRLEMLSSLLPQLIPLLRVKGGQAKVLYDFVDYRLMGNHGKYNTPYDDKCFNLAKQIRALNGNTEVF